jgi:transposase
MEAIIKRVCGLDIHKNTIVACVRIVTAKNDVKIETKSFATYLQALTELVAWLMKKKVEAIAMEGTGVYWRPLYALLEGHPDWKLIVGNAMHIKNVPGRKTDVKDAQWLAELVAHGLIQPSFIPPPEIRGLRDVLRMRTQWVGDRTRARNRILKTLQLVGIKLDSVASDAFGKTGIAILRALAEGKATPKEMAKLAKGTLRNKIDALAMALESPLDDIHRRMLARALKALHDADERLAEVDTDIESMLTPYQKQVDLLATIPGVDRVAAATVIAELGPDMSVFPTAAQAASWAGLSPGNHESAGKKKSSRITPGNRYLKTMLCQSAHAASHTKKGYLRDKFYRLKARRGHGRALIAIAHKILIAAYHILKKLEPYADLGDTYLDQRDRGRTIKSLVARLEALGVDVTITTSSPPNSAQTA